MYAFPIKCTEVILGDDKETVLEIQAEYDLGRTIGEGTLAKVEVAQFLEYMIFEEPLVRVRERLQKLRTGLSFVLEHEGENGRGRRELGGKIVEGFRIRIFLKGWPRRTSVLHVLWVISACERGRELHGFSVLIADQQQQGVLDLMIQCNTV
ncbi:unnamed protein product [Fraxinus pennsylvanica]|uniref:Uncharacterized protein n=1 Tax=Fraxinus pennsylvanica TaxID=56036 RepID=A0AAD2DXX3_9LAMI|nr:unnamed protein product [Fraxinus pennsylvanica]